MYSVLDYAAMASDGVRMSAYARAIERAVKPGSVVLDLGSGTGIFALLAARAGARHVHAVDVNPAIWVASDLAAENGFADRITVHEASSFDVELPEVVDVIVSDMRGKTPFSGDHLAAIRDARARWLKPGGVAMPARDDLFVAAVEADAISRDLRLGWETWDDLGFSAAAARASILNTVHDDRRRAIPASAQLTTAERWTTVDYAGEAASVFGGTVELVSTRRGTAHGLTVWFEATVFEDIRYGSTPGQELAYARCFLPLLEPVKLRENDRIEVSINADVRGTRWSWQTRVRDGAGAERAMFRQASFLGMPTSPKALLRSSPGSKPVLSTRGERMRRVLEAMDGALTCDQIIEQLTREMSPGDPHRALVAEEVRASIRDFGR